MKRAETCSCSLCNKLYISVPPYSCVRQVYTLQSRLPHVYVCMIMVALRTTDNGWFGFYITSAGRVVVYTHTSAVFVHVCIFIVYGTTYVLELHIEWQYSYNVATMYAYFIKRYTFTDDRRL